MKTFLKNLLLMGLLLLGSITLFAQDGGEPNPFDVQSIFASFFTLVAIIPVVVEFLKGLLGKSKATPDIIVQVFSWVIGIILTMIGWALNLGFLSEMTWWWALIYGFAASLAANGVFDTKIIQGILNLFKKK